MFDPDPSPYRAADLDAEEAEVVCAREARARGATLPLGAQPLQTPRGWSIRLPIRSEQVWVEKRARAVEEVTVRLRRVEDLERRVATLRREELDVRADGDLESTRRVARPAADSRIPRA